MTGAYEWGLKKEVESESATLWNNMQDQGQYNVYRAIKELETFFNVVQKEHHLTFAQREYLDRARLTFDKIFKYK